MGESAVKNGNKRIPMKRTEITHGVSREFIIIREQRRNKQRSHSTATVVYRRSLRETCDFDSFGGGASMRERNVCAAMKESETQTRRSRALH